MVPETVRVPEPPSVALPARVTGLVTPAVPVPVSAPTPPAPVPDSVRGLATVTPLTSSVPPGVTAAAEVPSAAAWAALRMPPVTMVAPV